MENIQKGKIVAICTSIEKGTVKQPVEQAVFIENHGIEGDAHAGKWHRQISLLASEEVRRFEEKNGNRIEPGAFGENLLTEGLELSELPCGSLIKTQDVILRLTQRGKECHTHCEIRTLTGDCIMPRKGVFAEVIKGGTVHAQDVIEVSLPPAQRPFTAAVITLSDRSYNGEREDKSGPLLAQLLREAGFEIIEELLLPDEMELLKNSLIRLADKRDADLIVTTGGTGFADRDITPEATLEVATRNAPGISEAIRAASLRITPHAMLSRGVSVIRNHTLIVNLPGSPKAVKESLEVIIDALPHGLGVLCGRESN